MSRLYPKSSIGELEKSGAIIAIQDGNHGEKHPTSQDYVSSGIPFIMANDITEGRINLETCHFIAETRANQLRIGFSVEGDVLLTHKGTIGNVAVVKKAQPFIMLTPQVTYYRTSPGKLSNQFLAYAFRDPAFLARMHAVSAQGTRPYIGIKAQRNLQIVYPPLPVQKNIVSILSAYDGLIENNLKRIALLEESARLLYWEWFVWLRFPGYEHTRIVDGMPEGWERKTIANFCESVSYGYTASAQPEEVGPKFLRITDIVPSLIDWSAVPHCEIPENKKEQYLLREGDIVIARTGATVGYAKRLHKRHPEAVFASYLIRLRLKPDVDSLLVGTYVESDDYKNFVKAHVGGAAQPNANAKVLSSATLLMPSASLQGLFRENAEAIQDQKEVLMIQNQKLKQARDLLLPRLMNGEIEV